VIDVDPESQVSVHSVERIDLAITVLIENGKRGEAVRLVGRWLMGGAAEQFLPTVALTVAVSIPNQKCGSIAGARPRRLLLRPVRQQVEQHAVGGTCQLRDGSVAEAGTTSARPSITEGSP
jgi:hypothetical protein